MNKILRLTAWLFFIGVCASNRSVAQSSNTQKKYIDFILAENSNTKSFASGTSYYLVHLHASRKKSDLAKAGIEVCRTLADGWVVIKSNSEAVSEQLIDQSYSINNKWKILDNQVITDFYRKYHFTIRTNATLSKGYLELFSISAKSLNDRGTLWRIHCTHKELIENILPLKEVVYAGLESSRPVVESRVVDLNLNPNAVNKIHNAYPDLSGTGMTLSVKEYAYDINDIDLVGRNIPSSLADTEVDNHATDMATIAVGAGNSFITGKGVAAKAFVTSSSFAEVLPDRDADYQQLNAWVQNHSYGTEIENFYGAAAEAFDESANANPTLLHIFSSGNSGLLSSPTGEYKDISGYANLTGNFKMAKNILTVGSVDTVGRPVDFSSKGPAYDGRIKPELVAYSVAGSSNSAALVSGISILLQQAYKESTGSLPPSSLLKALLINGAEDAGSEGIDFSTGYGNVNSYKSLQSLLATHYILDDVADDEEIFFNITIPENTKNLKVTLVWNDKAATPNSEAALLNDLDLVVKDPSNHFWLPWVLNPAPNVSALTQQATRGADHLNTIEQVLIENPLSGEYILSITGFDVPTSKQEFALVYQLDTLERFEWYFPTASDNMPYNGETVSYISWRSSFEEQTGKLEYSIDGGQSWELISASVDLKKGHYRWHAPAISSSAIVRMSVGSNVFVSDRFSISRPLQTSIGFNCTDSVMLQWKRVDNATSYAVLTLGSSYMESILTTVDTFAIFKRERLASAYFSVQPYLSDDPRPLPSFTFDYTQQGVDCFISSFIALVRADEGIELILQVGTIYGIDSVVFERDEGNGVFASLSTVLPTENLLSFVDTEPLQGLNTHRARIFLQNGQQIIAEEQDNLYLTTLPVIMFPNPVYKAEGSQLYIATRNFAGQKTIVKLYNTNGKEVLQQELFSDRDVVDVSAIAAGLYVSSVEVGGKKYTYRIIIY